LPVRPALGIRWRWWPNPSNEAGALGVSALKNSGWVDAIAPGTELEIEVREPATCHRLTVQQICRWCGGVAVSPDETLKKRRLKQLLA
jgi:hypothetical protein